MRKRNTEETKKLARNQQAEHPDVVLQPCSMTIHATNFRPRIQRAEFQITVGPQPHLVYACAISPEL